MENPVIERPTLPEASKKVVLKRDKKLETKLKLLSKRVRQEREREAAQKPAPTFRFLRTVVR